MSIIGLLLVFITMLAVLTLPTYFYKRNVKKDVVVDDALYAKLYDSVHFDQGHLENEVRMLHEADDSYTLDVGCGTGNRVGLAKHAVGVDVSPSMVAVAKKKYPSKTFVVGDVLQRDLFAPDTFTDVWCLGNTVYYLPEKMRFFQNVRRWLEDGGRFVLQLQPDLMFLKSPYRKNFRYESKRVGNVQRERLQYQKNKITVETRFYPENTEKIVRIAQRVGFELQRTERDFYFFVKMTT